jgi:hypothetical protein
MNFDLAGTQDTSKPSASITARKSQRESTCRISEDVNLGSTKVNAQHRQWREQFQKHDQGVRELIAANPPHPLTCDPLSSAAPACTAVALDSFGDGY